jgi:glycoside/pentoside/hexuronide:cation symporter, GPH family
MMNKVSFPLLSVYSLPVLSTIMFVLPLGSIMPAYYSEHTSITMAAIGMILVVSRIIDAITDPIIGYLSDKTKTPIGRRKPWMIAGGILAMICAYPLFIPPPDAGIFYFAFWSILAYQAWTLISIPHNAWASELSSDYVTKSKVFAF